MVDKRSKRSNDDNLHRGYSDSSGKADITRKMFKDIDKTNFPKEIDKESNKIEYEIKSTCTYIKANFELCREMGPHAEGFWRLYLQRLRDTRDCKHFSQLKKKDPETWLQQYQDCANNLEQSKNELEHILQLSISEHFDKPFEALKQDIKLLNPEEQGAFSTQFEKVSTEVKDALREWRQAKEDLRAKPPDDQLAQENTQAIHNLNRALKNFESLKKEIIKKVEQDLDERFRDTTKFCKGLSMALPRYMEANESHMDQNEKNEIEELIKKHKVLSKKFGSQRDKVRTNYGTSTTYSDYEHFLKKLENAEDKIVKLMFPGVQERVSKSIEPIRTDANYIHDLLKSHGIADNPYSPEAVQDSLQKIERETLRKLLTRNTDPEIERKREGPLEEVKRIAAEVEQERRKYNDIVEQVDTSLDNIRSISKQHNLSETPADRFSDTFQKKLDDALFKGALGPEFEALEQIALDIHQANWDYDTFTEIVSQLKSFDEADGSTLQQEQYDASLQEKSDTSREGRNDALPEDARGSNGDAFKALEQVFSDIQGYDPITKIVSQLKSSNGADGSTLQQEQYDALLKTVQDRHQKPDFKALKADFQVRERALEEEINKRYNALKRKFREKSLDIDYECEVLVSRFDMQKTIIQYIPSSLINKRYEAMLALQKTLLEIETVEQQTPYPLPPP